MLHPKDVAVLRCSEAGCGEACWGGKGAGVERGGVVE